ncbi:septal ring lytic transglycosylase RlpA family lipoprotein [Chitinophaga caeni]|uniref:Probable endolytic peptidoglycan transglycosylase RlpA n=1 Tax=Chitinophaga caeni TaxID=2029983 RepID=A0A291QRX3_9BACT|nr:septal ring lytic transglycosylase RlpA family protein [Chitinophaga caeni]ATL46643.1 septal ring lytic transglycosylase RlpA family lipoprotein [Chitinophaga caeni]
MIRNVTGILCLFIYFTTVACSSSKVIEKGKASYYADKFEGRKTASGATFKQRKLTAAHKTLPFGTVVKVKNLDNGKTVKVTINDRGPFVAGRIVDLSKKAAKKLGMVRSGVAKVQIKYKKPRKR